MASPPPILADPRPEGGGDMAALEPQSVVFDEPVERFICRMCIRCVDNTEPAWSASTGELVHSELHRQLNEFHGVWRELERRLPTGNDYVRLRQQEMRADERGLTEDVLR